MERKIASFLFLFLFSVSLNVVSQENERPVVISPRVGPEIDAQERDQFGLFPQVSNFLKATFYESADSSFRVRIEQRERSGKLITTTVRYSRSMVLMMAERIDHHEGLIDGTYVIGQEPAALLPARTLSSDVLPFFRERERTDIFPRFVASYGLSTYAPDFGAVQRILDASENKYRSQGYAIPHRVARPAPSSFSWFTVKLLLSENIGVVAHAGSTGSDEKLNVKAFSAAFLYRIDSFEPRFLRPYVTLGVDRYTINIAENYGYDARVSPVDTSGGYLVLRSVIIGGMESAMGLSLGLGVELVSPGFGSKLGINTYIRQNFLPAVHIGSVSGEGGSLRIGSFQAGADLQYYF